MSTAPRPTTFSATILVAGTQSGVTVSPVATVPINLNFVRLVLDVSSHSNAAQHIDLKIEISFDGGVTWPLVRSVGRDGGPPFTTASFDMDIPQPSNNLRRARATLTITGSPTTLSTGITIAAG